MPDASPLNQIDTPRRVLFRDNRIPGDLYVVDEAHLSTAKPSTLSTERSDTCFPLPSFEATLVLSSLRSAGTHNPRLTFDISN